MRMLHCPFRSCFNASRRLEGGKRRSLIVVAALSCVSRIVARTRISGGNRRDFPVAKKRSVSEEVKERITNSSINYLFMPVNDDWRTGTGSSNVHPSSSQQNNRRLTSTSRNNRLASRMDIGIADCREGAIASGRKREKPLTNSRIHGHYGCREGVRARERQVGKPLPTSRLHGHYGCREGERTSGREKKTTSKLTNYLSCRAQTLQISADDTTGVHVFRKAMLRACASSVYAPAASSAITE